MNLDAHVIVVWGDGEDPEVFINFTPVRVAIDLVESLVNAKFVPQALEALGEIKPGEIDLPSEYISPKLHALYRVEPFPLEEKMKLAAGQAVSGTMGSLLLLAGESLEGAEKDVDTWMKRALKAEAKSEQRGEALAALYRRACDDPTQALPEEIEASRVALEEG